MLQCHLQADATIYQLHFFLNYYNERVVTPKRRKLQITARSYANHDTSTCSLSHYIH